MILLATPVGGLRDCWSGCCPRSRRAILTDAGSTKAEVVDVARAAWAALRAVRARPSIAGAERTRPGGRRRPVSRAQRGAFTPLPETRRRTWLRVRPGEACGATVVDMEAQAHDRVFASVSHLPHLLSAVYMEQVATAADARRRRTWRAAVFGISAHRGRFAGNVAGHLPVNRDAMLTELAEVRAVLDRAERRSRSARWRRPAALLKRRRRAGKKE